MAKSLISVYQLSLYKCPDNMPFTRRVSVCGGGMHRTCVCGGDMDHARGCVARCVMGVCTIPVCAWVSMLGFPCMCLGMCSIWESS